MQKILIILAVLLLSVSFIYAQPLMPELVSPADMQTQLPIFGTELVWQQPDYEPPFYQFEVRLDIDPGFFAPPVYLGPGMELQNGLNFELPVPGLIENQLYYWYVRVTDTRTMLSENSFTRTFTTGGMQPPDPPVLISPFNGMTDLPWTGVQLVWQQPDYNIDSFFDVFCDIEPGFSAPPIYSGTGIELQIGMDFVFNCPPLVQSQIYHWKVRVTKSGLINESPVYTYTTSQSDIPEPPILWSPQDWEHTVIPEMIKLGFIKPEPIPPESFFDIFTSISPDFPELPVYTGPGIPDPDEGPDHYQYLIPELPDGETYYWKVRFTDGTTGLSSESPVWQFTALPAMLPNVPEPVLPPPGVNLPVLNFTSTPSATFNVYYETMLLSAGFDFSDPDAPEPPPGFNLNTYPDSTGYVAKCTVKDADGDMASESVAVGIEADSGPPIPLWALNTNGNLWLPGTPYPLLGQPGPWIINLSPLTLGDRGEYIFYILIVRANIDPRQSVNLISPPDLVIDIPYQDITLEWELPDGYYQIDSFFDVYCDIDSLFPNPPVFSGPIAPQRPLWFTYESLPLLPDQTYYWSIRYTNPAGNYVVFSEARQFTTGDNLPPEPLYAYPTNHLTGVRDTGLLLQWGPPPGRVDFPADSFFDVYCDVDPLFPSPPIFSGVQPAPPDPFNPPNYAFVPDLLLNTQYYWKVRVTDPATGLYSAGPVWDFITADTPAPPVLIISIAPPNQAQNVNPQQPLVLMDLPEMELAPAITNDLAIDDLPPFNIPGEFLAPVDWIPLDPIEGLYYCQLPLLLENHTYFWNVRHVNLEDHYYGISETREFTTGEIIPAVAPVLLLPLDDAVDMPVQNVGLSWDFDNYVADSFFDVYCDIDPAFPNPPVYSGDGVPWEMGVPPHTYWEYEIASLLPNQTYYWYVRATSYVEDYAVPSLVRQFTTGNFAIPYSTITGTISSPFGVSGIRVTCPQACAPNSVFTNAAGYYSFVVNNGLNPVVIPTPPGPLYYFTPGQYSYTNIQADQTADFTMSILLPNSATQPIPVHLATDVSINIGQLQWTYIQLPEYSPPTGFYVYFPAGSPEPYAVVPYDRDPEYTVGIPLLEYSSPYDWEVIPFNSFGLAEDVFPWHFETDYNDAILRVYFEYPDFDETDVEDEGLVMQWGPPPDREEFPAESFFDVYCDIDSLFPNPPIYSGPGVVDPLNPSSRHCYAPSLSLNTTYYWYIVLTDLSTGLSAESDTWIFTTQPEHIPLPTPVLVYPPDLITDVDPCTAWLEWDWVGTGDSYFEIGYGLGPDTVNNTVTGYWNVARTLLTCPLPDLLPGTAYYWYVRYADFVEHYYTISPVWSFTTGTGAPAIPLPPQNPVITIMGPDIMLEWDPVMFDINGDPVTPDYYTVYYSPAEPYNGFIPLVDAVGTTWMHPGAALMPLGYYYIRAVVLP